MRTVGDALRCLSDRFRAVGVASARLDARLLTAEALGLSATAVFSHPERPLSPAELDRLEALARRRERREPVSRILGRREFWSLTFTVTPDTLDPRPDTETVVEAVLDLLPDRRAPLRVLDFGTGTGCVLLALLSELPEAHGLGVDISPETLAVANDNARNLALGRRARFVLGDWGQDIDEQFDVIVTNPPYIPNQDIAGLDVDVAAFDPTRALAGGPDGLDCYRALAPHIRRLLAPGGVAALEVGQGQSEAVGRILEEQGLMRIGVRQDLAGVARCVVVSQPQERLA